MVLTLMLGKKLDSRQEQYGDLLWFVFCLLRLRLPEASIGLGILFIHEIPGGLSGLESRSGE